MIGDTRAARIVRNEQRRTAFAFQHDECPLSFAGIVRKEPLVATATGPKIQFVPPGNTTTNGSEVADHPSGANLDVAQRIGVLINSFSWKGDAVRVAH